MQSSNLSRVLFGQGSRRYCSPSNIPIPTINELVKPKGDWQTNYDALNKKNTLHLVVAVGMFIATFVLGKAGGFLEMQNDYPERPTVIDNYKTYKG